MKTPNCQAYRKTIMVVIRGEENGERFNGYKVLIIQDE